MRCRREAQTRRSGSPARPALSPERCSSASWLDAAAPPPPRHGPGPQRCSRAPEPQLAAASAPPLVKQKWGCFPPPGRTAGPTQQSPRSPAGWVTRCLHGAPGTWGAREPLMRESTQGPSSVRAQPRRGCLSPPHTERKNQVSDTLPDTLNRGRADTRDGDPVSGAGAVSVALTLGGDSIINTLFVNMKSSIRKKATVWSISGTPVCSDNVAGSRAPHDGRAGPALSPSLGDAGSDTQLSSEGPLEP